jgi:hypothetical protein
MKLHAAIAVEKACVGAGARAQIGLKPEDCFTADQPHCRTSTNLPAIAAAVAIAGDARIDQDSGGGVFRMMCSPLLAQQDARERLQGRTDRRNIAFRGPPVHRGIP